MGYAQRLLPTFYATALCWGLTHQQVFKDHSYAREYPLAIHFMENTNYFPIDEGAGNAQLGFKYALRPGEPLQEAMPAV